MALKLRENLPGAGLIGLGLASVALAAVLTEIAYRTSAVVPIGILVGTLGLVLAFWRPLAALCFAFALVPFELASVPIGGSGLSPAEAMLALTAIGWLARRLAAGEAPWTPSPLGKPYVLLILAGVPSLASAPDTYTAAKTLVFWTLFLLLFQMVVSDGRVEAVRAILFTLVIAGAVVGAIAYVKSGGGAQQQLIGYGEAVSGRATGTFGDPNSLATFEAMVLPGALALGLAGRPSLRLPSLAAFAVIFAGLALSLSRGGLLAVAGALVAMFLWAPFRRAALVAGLIVVVIVASGTVRIGQVQEVDVLTQRLSSVSYSAAGVDERFVVWQAVPHMFADHWVFGVGENQFRNYAPDYGLVNLNETGTFEHAHNIFFTIACELGIIGLGALLWLGVALTRVLVRALRRARGANRGLAFAVTAGFVAVFVQGMVDYTLRANVITAALFVLAGCAVVLERSGTPGGGPGRSDGDGDGRGARGPLRPLPARALAASGSNGAPTAPRRSAPARR